MKNKQKKTWERKNFFQRIFGHISEGLAQETKHSVLSVFSLVLGVFFLLAPLGYAGVAGDTTYRLLSKVFGTGFFIIPPLFLIFTVFSYASRKPHIVTTTIIGSVLFLIGSLGLADIFFPNRAGYMGRVITYPLDKFFGVYAGSLFLVAFSLIGILVMFNTKVKLPLFLRRKKVTEETFPSEEITLPREEDEDREDSRRSVMGQPPKTLPFDKMPGAMRGHDLEPSIMGTHFKKMGRFSPPPLSLLEEDRGTPNQGDIKANANIIKRTLLNFGIEVEADDISIGPSITRYAIKPAEGVRLSRIVALQNDLALALAAHPLRIEAPIPGKSLVGIEVPNTRKSLVGLASLLSAPEFAESKEPLLVSLGKSVTGIPIFSNISRAPHLLIAGATGAGKSVSIHSIITSLLYRNAPEMLRFIMIDPKRVELTLYNGIPHLLTPVVTNAKKAILALKWAIKEMERRYLILETEKVRDIKTYHATILTPELSKLKGDGSEMDLLECMPYIVIIVDELADIMSTFPKEFEAAVVRLAQMSRAVGIHLVLSTQRPSVNVITGLIKANIPSRVALQVSSQIDSRTILDAAGAEKLLGAGDMLYLSGEMSKPLRLQSAYVSEPEVKRVVKFFRKEYADELSDDIDLGFEENRGNRMSVNLDEEALSQPPDEFYEEAKELVSQTGRASTSYLQRKLGLGYARAARLMDMLEERGVVGPSRGAKPREVIGREIAEEGNEESFNEHT